MNSVHYQLWMGSLEPYMTETFILSAFKKMGANPLNVKVVRDKVTGEPAGFCFVHFASDQEAVEAMHRLNGRPVPGTYPIVRFRLNNANYANKNVVTGDYSIWVSNLAPDVDEYKLYRVFSSKYSSIKAAKVILDSSGFSKGYGFVQFGEEQEKKNALVQMNGFLGLGNRPLKICNTVSKVKGAGVGPDVSPFQSSLDYTSYCENLAYWQNYNSWIEYYKHAETATPQASYNPAELDARLQQKDVREESDLELVEHTVPLDVEKLNSEYMEQDMNLWDALESSKWDSYDQETNQ